MEYHCTSYVWAIKADNQRTDHQCTAYLIISVLRGKKIAISLRAWLRACMRACQCVSGNISEICRPADRRAASCIRNQGNLLSG